MAYLQFTTSIAYTTGHRLVMPRTILGTPVDVLVSDRDILTSSQA